MDENKEERQPVDPQLPNRGSAGSYPGRRLQKESAARRLWREYGFAPVTIVVMVVLFKVILQIAWVPSGSMEETLPTRSLLLSWQMPYVFADPTPQRGDIVTFESEELGKLLVKRVIGLPGDTVTIKNGYVYINGEKLDESYLPRQGVTAAGNQEEYVVPEGCLFFLGDNRTNSQDARLWDNPYIPVDKVRSHVLVCISFLKENSWRGVRVVS